MYGILLLGILGPSWALSAPLATPTPGTGTVISPTVPNPTQFNFSPGVVGSSSQVNSNFYGLESQIFALIGGLNGCAWIPSAAIGSVTVTLPLTASIGSCVANGGAGVNLTLAAPSVATDYTNAGGQFGITEHIVRGSLTVNFASGATVGTLVTVNLSGAAVFQNASSYQVTTTIFSNGSIYPTGALVYSPYVNTNSTAFQVNMNCYPATTSTGAINVSFIAIGT